MRKGKGLLVGALLLVILFYSPVGSAQNCEPTAPGNLCAQYKPGKKPHHRLTAGDVVIIALDQAILALSVIR